MNDSTQKNEGAPAKKRATVIGRRPAPDTSKLCDFASLRDDDLKFMQHAIEMARCGEGLTRPNPPVGAVIVKDGKIIGEGWHQKAGGPHAEVLALGEARDAAHGATLYVTLEPCSTFGRTPPCTTAILSAGISRIVAACTDPNPNHSGLGLTLLEKRGIEVLCFETEHRWRLRDIKPPAAGGVDPGANAGSGEEGVPAVRLRAKALIEPFETWMTKKRPFVTLKLAMTLDGRIADAKRNSQWITGEASRNLVHDLRRRADAIMVGVGTLNADDPSLLPRPDKGRKPWRVIVDTNGRANPGARVLNDEAAARTLIATANENASALAQIILLPKKSRRVSLPALMSELASRDILHVVCEGGGELAASLLREKLVDELWIFIAPKIFGGRKATPVVGGNGWLLANAPDFTFREIGRVGDDVLLKARRK